MRVRLTLAGVVAGFAAAGCGGGNHWSADNSWMGEEPKEHRPHEAQDPSAAQPSAEPASPAGPNTALVGVRPDVMISPAGGKSARCTCLAVEIGSASDAKFAWQNGPPNVGGDALVIAVSAKGVACPGGAPDESKRRASISAVDREGSDVVVEIEEVPEGRPIASGAIIPKPTAGGGVYVRGRSKALPYAQPTNGKRCHVM
jgi:hypothetical protein